MSEKEVPAIRKVYIAGPLSKGDLGINIANAIKAANQVVALGAAAYVPHLTTFWQFLSAAAGEPTGFADYDYWLKQDFAWLECCDALLRLPGESVGADMEEQEARRIGIPIFHSVEDLAIWLSRE